MSAVFLIFAVVFGYLGFSSYREGKDCLVRGADAAGCGFLEVSKEFRSIASRFFVLSFVAVFFAILYTAFAVMVVSHA